MSESRDPARRFPHVLVCGTVLSQPMGGVVRHNMELLPRLSRLLTERGGSLAVMEGREPIAFALPPEVERIATDTPSRPIVLRAARERFHLARILREASGRGAPFDLVHTAHFPAPTALDVPYTLTIHDLRRLQARESGAPAGPFAAGAIRASVHTALVKRGIERSAAVITVSETVRSEIVERFSFPRELVHVVPNAADHFEPLPRNVHVGSALLCLGHVEPRKNIELVLRTLAIDATLPPLALAGAAKGREEARLTALARKLGVLERVRFLGPFEDHDLARLYSEAACVVLPSHIEGFGIVALEAQRARAPLCVARAGALIEVAGADTPHFSPSDARECALAIHRALSMADAELDRASRHAARFAWDRSASAQLDAWSGVLGRLRSGQRPGS